MSYDEEEKIEGHDFGADDDLKNDEDLDEPMEVEGDMHSDMDDDFGLDEEDPDRDR